MNVLQFQSRVSKIPVMHVTDTIPSNLINLYPTNRVGERLVQERVPVCRSPGEIPSSTFWHTVSVLFQSSLASYGKYKIFIDCYPGGN